MKRLVLVRPAAGYDLEEQADYLAVHESLEAGLRLYRRAEETFRLLADHPGMGKLAGYRNPILEDIRVFPLKQFPNHLIFYRALKAGIEVVRVLHGARDIEHLVEDWGA